MPNPTKIAIAKQKPEQKPRQFTAPFTPRGTNQRTIALRKIVEARKSNVLTRLGK